MFYYCVDDITPLAYYLHMQPITARTTNQSNMNNIIASKLATLLEIRIANYKMQGDMHPEVAAQYHMDYTLQVLKGQEKYAEELLNYYIEQALKYRQEIAA